MADNGVLRRKAYNAQLIYEDLLDRLGMEGIPTTFVADEGRRAMLSRACFSSNPFPAPLSLVLTKLRIPAVRKLFEPETIPQTSAIAAVLCACSAAATEIGALRGDDVSGAQQRCDLVFAGLQAVRLYMSDHKHCKEFTRSRVQSAIRVNNALNGEGPFSPERAGTAPARQLADLCFSGKYTHREIRKMLNGRGGLLAYLGTTDVENIVRQIHAGAEKHRLVLDAMLYTVAKEIGAMHVALHGQTDAIILTGGIAFNGYCVDALREWTERLAPVVVIPGEDEMGALAANAIGALKGTLPLQEYNPKD